jgi:hypothetical protein
MSHLLSLIPIVKVTYSLQLSRYDGKFEIHGVVFCERHDWDDKPRDQLLVN